MSYRKLEIWQMARELSVEIHRMTIDVLPKYEMFEEGAQLRRSMKSVRSNIVEGYGRRRYKQEFIRFLTYAHASCDESIDHLDTLFGTGSLQDRAAYDNLLERMNILGSKINVFIQSVEVHHQSVKEPVVDYDTINKD